MYRKTNKYNATKIEVDGIVFDSRKEARYYRELKFREQAGEISDLKLQVKYVLIPATKEPDTIGKRGGVIKGKTIERELCYIADFTFIDKDGNLNVIDVKGCKIGAAYQIFKIKKKIFLWKYGIEIQEV